MSINTLRQYLEQFRIPEGDRSTVATITIQTGGKFHIPDSEYETFLDRLHTHLFKEKGRPMNIIEQPSPAGPKPLVIDLDFRTATRLPDG